MDVITLYHRMKGKPMADPAHYETFEASELFCPRCKQAQPVRKYLLLVLPTGNKYDYRCTVCATSVGEKMDNDPRDFTTLMRGS
jgi:hypothetical protein